MFRDGLQRPIQRGMRILLGFLLTSVAAAQPCPEVGVTIEMTAPALIESTEGGEFVTRALLPGDQREVLELVTEDGREQVRLKGGWCFCDEIQWQVVARPPHVQVMRITGGAELIAPRQELVPVIRPAAQRARTQAVQDPRGPPAVQAPAVKAIDPDFVGCPYPIGPEGKQPEVGMIWIKPYKKRSGAWVRGHWKHPSR